MRIAVIAPECDPIIKVGGLADVVASLPRALKRAGHDVQIYVPRYASIPADRISTAVKVGSVDIKCETLPQRADIWMMKSRDVVVNLVECGYLFDVSPLPYGPYANDPARWASFSLAVLESLAKSPEPVDVIHLHDGALGLLPIYKSLIYKESVLAQCATLFTVHNLAHAGRFGREWLPKLGLPDWLFDSEQIEFHGECSALKAGLLWSTMIGTVSPTHATEIQGPALGCGMDGLLRKRVDDLVGILNGVDTEVWDPAAQGSPEGTEPWFPFAENSAAGRVRHTAVLRKKFNLEEKPDAPVFGFVGGLVEQRGIKALLDAIPAIVAQGGQVAVLGEGAEMYERALRECAVAHAGAVGVTIGFDTPLARRVYAGSDFFLMPSKFEPCGLSQMIACRFGSIPIVSFTGGLADTVRDVDDHSGGNGLAFLAPVSMDDHEWHPVASKQLLKTVERAFRIFKDKTRLDRIRRRAMQIDFSWDRPARKYEDTYFEAVRRERGIGGHHGP